jgi:hypothetical protein
MDKGPKVITRTNLPKCDTCDIANASVIWNVPPKPGNGSAWGNYCFRCVSHYGLRNCSYGYKYVKAVSLVKTGN